MAHTHSHCRQLVTDRQVGGPTDGRLNGLTDRQLDRQVRSGFVVAEEIAAVKVLTVMIVGVENRRVPPVLICLSVCK